MDKGEKLMLFWICIIVGIACTGVGIGQYSVGLGWISAGILTFLMIPIGLEFNKKFVNEDE